MVSSPYSIEELDELISNAVSEMSGITGSNLKQRVQPLENVDTKIELAIKQQRFDEKIRIVRDIYLPRYNDSQYLDYYRSVSKENRPGVLEALRFALIAKDDNENFVFTEEERNLINEMIRSINTFEEALKQAEADKKKPKNIHDPKTYHMHSGGADGSDSDWHDIAVEFGMIDDPQHISHYYWN